jgi:hypothetical protein
MHPRADFCAACSAPRRSIPLATPFGRESPAGLSAKAAGRRAFDRLSTEIKMPFHIDQFVRMHALSSLALRRHPNI